MEIKIDVDNCTKSIYSRKSLNDQIDIIFDILLDIKWDKKKKTLKFTVKNSDIYLEKNKIKSHLEHKCTSTKIMIEQFSLWLGFQNFHDALTDEYIEQINKIDMDHKINVCL